MIPKVMQVRLPKLKLDVKRRKVHLNNLVSLESLQGSKQGEELPGVVAVPFGGGAL